MKKLLIIISISLGLCGCKALIEENIRNSKVNVLFPKAGDSVNTYNVNFWWDNVADANTYEIQIVQGTFNSIQNFLVDSVVSTNKYNFILTPGNYQWRVRGLNNSTQTDFATQSFVVLRNDSLSAQTLILRYPPYNFSSNQTTQIFRWYPLSQASYYTFQLQTAAGGLIYSTDVFVDSIVISGIQQGDLQWKVRANNNNSSTPFFSRALNIDTSAPNIPILLSPNYGDSVSTPFDLTWDRGTISGSSITDSVILYSDSLITVYKKSISTSSSYSLTTIPSGTYFWRVRSVDQAGNTSGYSLPGKFKAH
jgi:hypothetical protein